MCGLLTNTISCMKILLLGCGHKKRPEYTNIDGMFVPIAGDHKNHYDKDDVVRLDINPDCNPDVLWDLNNRPLPFEDGEFDEIHAYEVMEHVGRQGDFVGYFSEMMEYARILKDGGTILGCVPRWDRVWAWGDPGHCKIITSGTLLYLDSVRYENEIGRSHITDYRRYLTHNLRLLAEMKNDYSLYFLLKKV